ncbi:transcriptional regulatory protein [Mycobacterium haemophilum DSM 44634]|uniref:LCP family protein n=1 Tax=Mycobacterium haemophilum TaxID=29311 RepID=UPI0006D472E8|nr:LCP family protein [Mycobacterium haemophilum]AKN15750.2 LytTR family transcriptional regulator [Mycobacterium haemophilum DSM 44634]MCV7341153.1 LCP family protein [Mycobacterium haemophilum DSM 44634]
MNGNRSPDLGRLRRPIPPPEPGPEPSQVIRRDTGPPAADQTMPLRRPRCPSSQSRLPTPPPRPVAPKTRRKRRIRRWSRVVALMLLIGPPLVSGGVVARALWFDTSLHREPILTDYPHRPAAGRGTNWLLVGSDSRQGLTAEQQQDLATGGDIGSGRTDTILLVHLPRLGSSRPVTMVSIPRDSYVPIPGHGHDKINAAFAMGGGPLLTQALEQATGLHLDHYAEIGFSGFAGLVDALGGVTVCPAEPVTDPLAGLDLPAGCQQLDGRNALGYVRTRATPRADLDRMVNQRQFMSALLHRATSPAVWLNPWRWYSVPQAAADALTVDQGDHVWDLARLGWALGGSPTTLTVPIGEFTTNDAGSVVVWNHDAARELFDTLASDIPVPASAVDGPQ